MDPVGSQLLCSWVIPVCYPGHTWTIQDPWDEGPMAYCLGESSSHMTTLWVAILISDFSLLRLTLLSFYVRLQKAIVSSVFLPSLPFCWFRKSAFHQMFVHQFLAVTQIWSLLPSAITYILAGLVAGEAQVTFLALPLYTNMLLQKHRCTVGGTAKVALGRGGQTWNFSSSLSSIVKRNCCSIRQCYIAVTFNNGCIVRMDFTQPSI